MDVDEVSQLSQVITKVADGLTCHMSRPYKYFKSVTKKISFFFWRSVKLHLISGKILSNLSRVTPQVKQFEMVQY